MKLLSILNKRVYLLQRTIRLVNLESLFELKILKTGWSGFGRNNELYFIHGNNGCAVQ